MPDILLVEDERALAEIIIREITASGFPVVHALDGEAALTLALTRDFSLVILDWMLPTVDGLEVLRRLRAVSSVPVLMLTARDTEADRVLGLEVGADDYVTKPFSMLELVARVRAMLRRRELIEQTVAADQHGDNAIIEAGSLRLDPMSYTLTIDGASIDLTRTEFALLHLLLRNPGRVFSRAYLLDTVWGETYIGGDRSIDNAILRLRRKLGQAGAALETVWGVGYRWKRS